ncbi:MAG: 3-methyl-2-oxobutanoate hydroxymethyltransferase [Acidimicrobiales bacterium]
MATTVPEIRARKGSGRPIVMVTAYDAPGAQIASDAGVDMILVGDSVANVVLGYEDTLRVSVEQMAHHVGAVARAQPSPLVVADMPWLSYHTGARDAIANAGRLIVAGAQAVKLEGGSKRREVVEAISAAEIPVMGHLGLTPQSLNDLGGYKVQGRELVEALGLLEDARVLCEAGCFAIVLEAVPGEVAAAVTEEVDVPTIGIGAGAGCDGQVLVMHDVLGLQDRIAPRFVRRYAALKAEATDALGSWAQDVRSGRFPQDSETYELAPEVARRFRAARSSRDGHAAGT